MTRDQIRQKFLADDTAYCCYCGAEQVSFGCCGENHFETFSQMSQQGQEDFLDMEAA
jgi:hypothetical protein